MDDLGAIIIIALFYNGGIDLMNLFIALGIFVSLLVLNRLRVRNLIPYLIGGAGMWYFMLHSGVHATISGVLLAFAIPFGNGDERSTSYLLQHTLHKPVAWLILPVFALANTAIPIQADITALILNPYSAGIMLGLLVGKPLGIFLFARISVKMRLGKLPADLSWSSIAGAGLLGGIGFTMSIFICLLAFDNEVIINNAKLAILIASTIAGICGYVWLKADLKRKIGYHK